MCLVISSYFLLEAAFIHVEELSSIFTVRHELRGLCLALASRCWLPRTEQAWVSCCRRYLPGGTSERSASVCTWPTVPCCQILMPRPPSWSSFRAATCRTSNAVRPSFGSTRKSSVRNWAASGPGRSLAARPNLLDHGVEARRQTVEFLRSVSQNSGRGRRGRLALAAWNHRLSDWPKPILILAPLALVVFGLFTAVLWESATNNPSWLLGKSAVPILETEPRRLKSWARSQRRRTARSRVRLLRASKWPYRIPM